ncbi:MAG: hypothetical protein AB1758_30485, partial [Candidatus Eremiobacterota bacterium]
MRNAININLRTAQPEHAHKLWRNGHVPSAEDCRVKARTSLPPDATDRVVELTALTLFEAQVAGSFKSGASGPQAVTGTLEATPVRPPGMDSVALYTTLFAASVGTSGLGPAVIQALAGFESGKILAQDESGDLYVGMPEDWQPASQALSSRPLPGGARLAGAWTDEEAIQVSAALEEMHRKLPGSKDLVQSVVLRSVLGGEFGSRMTSGLYRGG